MDANRTGQRLGCRRGAVIEREVGDGEADEFGNEGLKFPHGLEHTLTYLGLVRRVRREEFAPSHELKDRCRDVISIQSGAQKRRAAAHVCIGAEQAAGVPDDLLLGLWSGQREFAFEANIRRNISEQIFHGRKPHFIQHFGFSSSIG